MPRKKPWKGGFAQPVKPAAEVRFPQWEGKVSLGQRIWEELVDHLIPWGPQFLSQRSSIKALSIALAVAVTIVWILGAVGTIRPAIVIAWWIGWSVYEVRCRSYCKPWIKEGPWWGRARRQATTFDLIAYVATKNLLIGAALFLVMSAFGWLG